MPQSSIKLVWSLSACAFCPRTAVRTCQIRPGKLLPKLSAALELDEAALAGAEGLCTCCLSDVDMIVRALAIKGAMRDYFLESQPPKESDANEHPVDGAADEQMSANPENSMSACPTECESNSNDLAAAEPPTQSCPPPSLTAMPKTPNPNSPIAKKHMMYQCRLCDKMAGSKSHCIEHLICHSAVRPFSCCHCRKTYKSRKACREHLVVMHNVEKVDAQLHKHMLVNQEDLKQLEDVCSQYKKIYGGGMKTIKGSLDGDSKDVDVKIEPKDDFMGSKSYWLYHRPEDAGVTSSLPPPLTRRPSSTCSQPPASADQLYQAPASPPAKRNRKGTPHKVVSEPADDVIDWDGVEEPPDPRFSFDEELSNQTDQPDDDSDSTVDSVAGAAASPAQSESPKKSDGESSGDAARADSPRESPISQDGWPALDQQFVLPDSLEAAPYSDDAASPANHPSRRAVPPCEMCGRSFPTKEKMADHKRSHSEIKQFSCLMCNRFFKYRRGVTNHLKEVHRLKDRAQISRLVASHEVGRVPVKDAAGKKRWVKTTDLAGLSVDAEPMDTDTLPVVSQQMVEDTLSSLVDIQDDERDSASSAH